MKKEPSDQTLCENIALQAALLQDAYATEDVTAIDHALIRVTDARRMMKNGLYELIYGDDLDAPAGAVPPSDP